MTLLVSAAPASAETAHGEGERLQALYAYDILDTDPEEAFDRLTRLTQAALQSPIAAISLIDEKRQWFKAKQGIEVKETPRVISFCTHTIQYADPMVITDALADPRFANSPLVVEEPRIRFYAGVPLRTRAGHSIGALCAMDRRARSISNDDLAALSDLAWLVIDQLELRRVAATDSLTGAMSRRSFYEQARRDFALAKRHDRKLSCAVIDLDHFKAVNDAYGHADGDLVLQRFVSLCKSLLRSTDYLGRIGGEEFSLMLPATALHAAGIVADRLRTAVAATPITVSTGENVYVNVSVGVAACSQSAADFDELLRNADFAEYDAKQRGRNRTVLYSPQLRMPPRETD